MLDATLPRAPVEYRKTREHIAATKRSPWLQLETAFEHAFVDAGGTLLAGRDSTGYGGQREVELLVEAGFTPVQAIRIATSNGASWCGGEIGSIEVGKAADLVPVRGDPAKNMKDIEHVALVFKDGTGYDPAKLVSAANGTAGLR